MKRSRKFIARRHPKVKELDLAIKQFKGMYEDAAKGWAASRAALLEAQAGAAAMRDAVAQNLSQAFEFCGECVPDAGYCDYHLDMNKALASDAGRKVAAVVEAARYRQEIQDQFDVDAFDGDKRGIGQLLAEAEGIEKAALRALDGDK